MDSNSVYDYQQLFGTVIKSVVARHVLEKRNIDKSWEYGYNEEYDFIVISKTGEIGDIYQLQNLRIALPKVPEDISEIRFFDKNNKQQKWKPYDIPQELVDVEVETIDWNNRPENKNSLKTPTEIFFMKPQSFVNKHLPYINEDFERRDFGVWIMINNKPFWIPPSHYFMLQHNTVHGKTLPDYRFTNRDYYLFWEAVRADKRALGMIYLKNRRSGASTMAGSECQNLGTRMEEGFIGIMSKTNRDSVSFMNRMVIRPFKKLPWYFKPQTSGTTSATSGLNFKEVAKKMSTKNTTMVAEGGLDTSIKQFSTSLNSMDGEKVDFMVLDEAGKYQTDVPFDQYWSIAEECLTEGFKIVGKAMIVSTVNAQAKGGKAFKDIYYASDVRKRMDNGRTISGLYSLFIPAEWNQEGGYDEWGYSIVEDPVYSIKNRDEEFVKKGNLNKLIEKGSALKKQSAVLYNEYLRKHPRNESQAFRDESSVSDFNLNKIYEQTDHNELLKPIPYERGNFINDPEGEEKYKIKWIPSKNGRFYINWVPPVALQNNFSIRGDEIIPLNDFGVFGVDPYKVSKTVDSRGGSKGGIHGLTDISMNVAEIPSNEFFLEYIHRPATIEVFIQDLMFACLFYGTPALIENNVDHVLREFRRLNMTRFCMRRKDKAKLSLDERVLGGVPMQSINIRQKHYFGIQTYIEKYIGIDDDGLFRDKGQMGIMPFNRTLQSWSKFTPDNRTSEDASISSGLCILGLLMKNTKSKTTKNQKEAIEMFGREYDYSSSGKVTW